RGRRRCLPRQALPRRSAAGPRRAAAGRPARRQGPRRGRELNMIEVLLCLLALPALLTSSYLLMLAIASRRRPAPAAPVPALRFEVVVPAHDEEQGIARTVRSLLALDYPAALRRVVVVADNCTDGTAARARAVGAEVLVRDEPSRRGKGHALAHAFEHGLRTGF